MICRAKYAAFGKMSSSRVLLATGLLLTRPEGELSGLGPVPGFA